LARIVANIIALNPNFELRPSANKKFREVIVFVHNYGGDRRSFGRHMDWVNELGFDVVTFDLPLSYLRDIKARLPVSKSWDVGLRHVWADKIEEVLGKIPERKIIYSFSFPAVAALVAISRRHAVDVTAWICEGGPFLDVARGVQNVFVNNEGVLPIPPALTISLRRWPLLQKYFTRTAQFLLGASKMENDVSSYFKMLPLGFPVLSISSEADRLVTPDMVDQFFISGFRQVDLQRLVLQKSDHLLGLKDEPEIYKHTVGSFLLQKGSKLTEPSPSAQRNRTT